MAKGNPRSPGSIIFRMNESGVINEFLDVGGIMVM